MVSGPRRDAGVGQATLGGDRRDDRLRAVAAGHRQRVGARGDGVAHEPLEVAPRGQLDRLDPTGPRLVGQLEPLRLAAAGLRVEEEDRAGRVRGTRERHVNREGGLGRGHGCEGHRSDHDELRDPTVENHDQHRREHERRRQAEAEEPRRAPADQPVPRCDPGADQERSQDQTPGKTGDHRVGGRRQRQRREHQGEDRGQRGCVI